MNTSLALIKLQMDYELEAAGVDAATWCCVDTERMYEWVKGVEEALCVHIEEAVNHNRLKEDTWNYEQQLLSENCKLRAALQLIMNMQTRGFITLGKDATDKALDALGGSK